MRACTQLLALGLWDRVDDLYRRCASLGLDDWILSTYVQVGRCVVCVLARRPQPGKAPMRSNTGGDADPSKNPYFSSLEPGSDMPVPPRRSASVTTFRAGNASTYLAARVRRQHS